MASQTIINSATTLDIRPEPGRDIRFPTTSSQSIFSFGNFRLEKDTFTNSIDNSGSTLSFGSYSTLYNNDNPNFDVVKIITTKVNELNLVPEDPSSYAYFCSFYSKVANAINNIVNNFPYAIYAKPQNAGVTIYEYSDNLVENYSTFKIPISSITNQANIIYVSGRTEESEAQFDLYNETDAFSIQLSGQSQSATTATTYFNPIHKILEYNYYPNQYLYFKIDGILLPKELDGLTSFNYPIYVRPSRERMGQYKRTISNLEKQLLYDGTFLVPNKDTETFERQTFVWPKTIDEFAPDSYGLEFEEYADAILSSAREIDERKTNIMLRTMLPEQYVDLDSDDKIYRKLTTVYAEEFDKIKQYIDGLAYAHSVNYKEKESVPNKFITRLANFLGAPLPNAFIAENILDYLAGEFDEEDTSFEEYNLDLWRRILTNIIYLYKTRGTRDAITFIFRLLGAPECLFNLEEFVYKVQQVVSEDGSSFNIADDGYPDLDNVFQRGIIFQQGGAGRGSGQEFINSITPEYDPVLKIDNKKTYSGSTRDTINSKELNAALQPGRAIECDVMDWYEMGYGWWNWGSTNIVFSSITTPFEWQVEDIDTVVPQNMSAMTIYEWLEYIYANNVDPRNRKTKGYETNKHTDTYYDLKKIYITYMLWANNQESNRLTFRKLESILKLLERNYQELVPFFIPSTSILMAYGTLYGNNEFNRHRFIYQPGINDGSEFQVEIPPVFETDINTVSFSIDLSNNFDPNINAVNFSVNIPDSPTLSINGSEFSVSVDTGINPAINVGNTTAIVNQENVLQQPFTSPSFNGTIIEYPTNL
jgi:hypothetical protein